MHQLQIKIQLLCMKLCYASLHQNLLFFPSLSSIYTYEADVAFCLFADCFKYLQCITVWSVVRQGGGWEGEDKHFDSKIDLVFSVNVFSMYSKYQVSDLYQMYTGVNCSLWVFSSNFLLLDNTNTYIYIYR